MVYRIKALCKVEMLNLLIPLTLFYFCKIFVPVKKNIFWIYSSLYGHPIDTVDCI